MNNLTEALFFVEELELMLAELTPEQWKMLLDMEPWGTIGGINSDDDTLWEREK